jgi:hypothetical protein
VKRALIAFALAGFFGFVLGGIRTAEAATPRRPGSEFATVQMLNGSPHRWTLPDAGQSIIVAAASAQGCADITGACSSVLMFVPNVAVNICAAPITGGTGLNVWDGGCNTIDTDPNFGVPLPAGVPQYLTLDPLTTQVCAVSDAGALRVPFWCMY